MTPAKTLRQRFEDHPTLRAQWREITETEAFKTVFGIIKEEAIERAERFQAHDNETILARKAVRLQAEIELLREVVNASVPRQKAPVEVEPYAHITPENYPITRA